MERYGVLIGVLLLAAVTALALGLARLAAASVKRYRADHGEEP